MLIIQLKSLKNAIWRILRRPLIAIFYKIVKIDVTRGFQQYQICGGYIPLPWLFAYCAMCMQEIQVRKLKFKNIWSLLADWRTLMFCFQHERLHALKPSNNTSSGQSKKKKSTYIVDGGHTTDSSSSSEKAVVSTPPPAPHPHHAPSSHKRTPVEEQHYQRLSQQRWK